MIEKQKFKLSENIFWILPLLSVVFVFCLKLNELAVPNLSLLLFFYILVWILASIYHKQAGKDDCLKNNLSNSMIIGIVLIIVCGILDLFGFHSDLVFVAFAMSASQILALPYQLYKIIK